MSFFQEFGTAALLVIATLGLQCAGIAALILWVRKALAGDIRRFGPFRSAVLVVRLTVAIIVMHGLLILFWASCYRWLFRTSKRR
jgi:NO-binding membrane sensor protein with MHYT domain